MTLVLGYVCASAQEEVKQGSDERQKAKGYNAEFFNGLTLD